MALADRRGGVVRVDPPGLPQTPAHFTQCLLASAPCSTIYVSGQVGIRNTGEIAVGMANQVRQAWANVSACLAVFGATLNDLVQVRSYVVDGHDLAEFQGARPVFAAGCVPTSTVIVVPRLIRPDYLFEVEVVAVLPATEAGSSGYRSGDARVG